MRVLHLSSEASWRGGEQQIAYLIEELLQQRIDNVVACRQGSPFEDFCKKQGLRHYPLPFKNSLDVKTALAIKKICQKDRIDLVHMHSSKSHGIAWLAGLLGNRTPLILSRRVDFPPKTNFLTRQKYNYPRIRRILCVSEAIRQVMLPHIQEQKKCVTVYSGIDLSKFSPLEPKGLLREAHPIPGDQLLIGNISAIAPHKDYYTFVNTAEELLKRKLPAKFLIIGTGPEEAAIKAYVAQRGLQEDVLFTGFLKNIPQIFPELDIFLMTSETEGLGTTLLDAFACRVPVVATEAGGIPEIVRQGHTGLTAAVKDYIGLANAVERLIKDPVLRTELVQNAYMLVQAFDKKQTALQTLDHYRQVLGEEE